jgi:glucose-6-phosphate 1-dehydrogenase
VSVQDNLLGNLRKHARMTITDSARFAQLLIFGGSGDLARRKLVPAVVRLARAGLLDAGVQVIGVGRRPMSDDAFREELRAALPADLGDAFEGIARDVHYRSADVGDLRSLQKLGAEVDALVDRREFGRLCYLALRPGLFATAIALLRAAGIVHRHDHEGAGYRRVVIEKPFGHDLASARALNDALHRELDEHQVLRIDHYLGKETVQNLLGLRFHNAIFEPVWNRHHVELVQITVAETIGVEKGRAEYYDGTGALRDVVQNHMLQVLALVAMEPPASLAADVVRNQKVEVLKALRAVDREDAALYSVRARYGPGTRGAEGLAGYLDEDGVAPDSATETYVALRAEVDNWRWRGVPFLLRHGKRLPRRFTEVQVQFRMPPIQLFNQPRGMSAAAYHRAIRDGALCQIRPNVLKIGIQPEETIGLSFGVKRPGPEMTMAPAALAFDYREYFGIEPPDAYERLLLDAMNGDATLFLRADEIEACWEYCDSILSAWRVPGAVPLREYAAGTWGPPEADRLFQGCEGGWTRG